MWKKQTKTRFYFFENYIGAPLVNILSALKKYVFLKGNMSFLNANGK